MQILGGIFMELKKQKWFKAILAMSLFMVMLFCTGLNVQAENVKDGISVTVSSNKEKYNSEDEVNLKITVKNTNDFEVSDIKIENILPDGISLVSGEKSKDNINLKANEEVSMNLTVKKANSGQTETKNITTKQKNTTINTTIADNTVSTTEKFPNTGENNTTLNVLIVMLISIVIMIICLFLKDRKKYSKFLSVLICLGVINAFGITGIVHASSKNNNSFTYEYTYKIDNADYIHKVVVSYSLSENSNSNSNNSNNNTDEEKKLKDGYVKDNLEQFAMKNRYDKLMDISKTIINNTKCEFKNVEYGKDGKGTADIIVFAPNMEKILSDGLKFATENQETILKYDGANLQEKFQKWVNEYSIELINSNKYEPLKTELSITIYKENNQWIINVDEKLNNALTGNINKFFEDQLNELYK